MRVFAPELNNDVKGIKRRDACVEDLIRKPDTKAGLRSYGANRGTQGGNGL